MTYFTIDDLEEPEERESEKEDEIRKSQDRLKPSNKVSFKFENKPKDMSKARKLLYWLCGVETYINKDHRKIDFDPTRIEKIDTSIDQTSFARAVCDVNAALAIAVCGFMYAFFNKFSNY